MERHVPFVKGELYHIYNRGVDKRKIFFSNGDWQHFQRLLYIANTTQALHSRRLKDKPLSDIQRQDCLVDIASYVMMGNHFHLLLREKSEQGITTFMRKLLTAYSMYMNRKYERSGPLMCRPFRAKHVDSDEYLFWLTSYIHMNPVEQIESSWKEGGVKDIKKVMDFLEKYKYSSYCDYFFAERDVSCILEKNVLPATFLIQNPF